ncbi:substrate-binding periplasmic protein [Candidatus Neptunichlamydia sp. REUL1]|uniref:substrate-binding periplasmic protein n=1 Tax=Candidatus Neptunichlamydia sp. REUL1 TaxID=3064277 RepID=UPI00293080FC|nr:transporter substrate-binding domain-containing protein [Candidatus Neptunochlamydia sp. REUL1]
MKVRLFCRVVLFFSLVFLLAACGSGGKTYRVGMDPSWYPIDLQGKETNVYAFANELLVAIGREEGVFFERVTMGWDNLIYGLKEKRYDGMLSSMTPRNFLERTYAFSDPILHIGPVLIVKDGVKVSALGQMNGREVAVDTLSSEAVLLERFPGVIVQYYYSIPDGLDDVIAGIYDGVLVNYIQATSYVRDLYFGKVKIATPPLNDAGIRLLTLNGDNAELVEVFNRGLDKLRSDGKLEKLLKKWELN